MVKALGPLILITEIAPVPGTVAGAHIVSSLRIYMSVVLWLQNYDKYGYAQNY
jgi:hypothetical protein